MKQQKNTGLLQTCLILLGAIVALLALYCRCVTIEEVQVGPDTWEGSFLARSPAERVNESGGPSDSQPAADPVSDIQSPQEILDELLERY